VSPAGLAAALVGRHRRLLAAACAAGAVAFALSALRSAAPHGVPVPAAARDLPSGATLRSADVRPVTMPAAAVPAGVVRSGLAGRVLAGPMRRGEPVTDARLIGRQLLNGYGAGLVAVPLRMADAASVRLLRTGDRIDVRTTAASPGDLGDEPADPGLRATDRARPLASAVPVIAVPGRDGDDGAAGDAAGDGALIVVAARYDQAAALASAAGGPRLAFVIVG
jgi:Flp pilus assembly protein CpaB